MTRVNPSRVTTSEVSPAECEREWCSDSYLRLHADTVKFSFKYTTIDVVTG